MSKDIAETMRGLDSIVGKMMAERDAEIARLTAEIASLTAEHRAILDAEIAESDQAVADLRGEIERLTSELAAARSELNAAASAGIERGRSWEATEWEAAFGVRNRREALDKLRAAEEQLAAARAVPADVEALVKEAVDGALEAGRCAALGHAYLLTRDPAYTVPRLNAAISWAIATAATPHPTVGGLLAAGEERESRAWSEKGKAPPGSCPFCASRISMVQRDGYFIARCSHRGCGAVGPRMRSVSRAADLFCQPPRREAQGMSCGPIAASPPRPRCSCTHEAGDSICDAHPSCSECGDSTARNVNDCADHCQVCASLRRGDAITDWNAACSACKSRGPLPKGG